MKVEKEKSFPQLTSNMEDYLECIYILNMENKVVRVKQIAQGMKVKMASVTGALKPLAEKGYIQHDPYGYVELTKSGEEYATIIYNRHVALTEFFHDILKIDLELSEDTACKIEHVVNKEVMERLVSFMKFLKTPKGKGKSILEKFEDELK